jgi:hypothetical protein
MLADEIARVSSQKVIFESPFGLELLATVHWVAKSTPRSSLDEITERVHSWNERKQQFTLRQFGLAVEVLSKKGWVEPVAA